MIIGIDIDDTITNHCEVWFKIYNENYRENEDKKLVLSDAYKWNFYDEYAPEIKERLFSALENQDMYYDNLTLLDNVKNTIQEIFESGHQIIFISATHKPFQERKKAWILSNFPELTEDNIIFTAQKNLINVDVMIDDNLDYASRFTCPFILFKRPWNTNRESSLYTDNVLICANWSEIEKYLLSQKVILPETINKEIVYSEATTKLIEGIKNAKTNQECIDILNPYIQLWQEQGILIGIAKMSDFLGKFAQDVEEDMNQK